MYLTQPVHRALQQYPDRIATIDGDRTRTFAEHADRIARLAGVFRDLGLERDDRVAVYGPNSDRFLECVVAVPWADGVLVPVNTRWSLPEVVDSLRECEPKILVVDEAFVGQAAELRAQCPTIQHVLLMANSPVAGDWLDFEEAITAATPVEDARRGGDALAALFYTGGTTGRSKGVMLSHANLVTSALGGAASGALAAPGGSYLHTAPMFHLGDLTLWHANFILGNTQVSIPAFTPQGVLEAISEHRVTELFLVPTMVQMLLEHPAFDRKNLSSLRRFLYGTAPMPPVLLERVASILPDVDFAQAYGMTELSPIATILSPEHHRHPQRRFSAGQAAPHSEVLVVDPEGHPVPTGTVGEVLCRGGHVMLGYWKQPEATAAAVKDGWMHTGDGGYLDEDGFLYIVDRIKDMIVSGGENVYSAEVEKALTEHPAVAACAVIGVPDEVYGERVHALVVTRPGHAVTAEDLRAHAKTLIAGYKAPRSVDFVEDLPLSAAGKVLKAELRGRYRARA